jgi:hypothetical protein
VTLEVDFERIAIGDSMLYVDPNWTTPIKGEQLLWNTVDFDDKTVHFMTW